MIIRMTGTKSRTTGAFQQRGAGVGAPREKMRWTGRRRAQAAFPVRGGEAMRWSLHPCLLASRVLEGLAALLGVNAMTSAVVAYMPPVHVRIVHAGGLNGVLNVRQRGQQRGRQR